VRQTTWILAGAALVFIAASAVRAHHSPSAIFDMSRRIVVKGTLTKIDWINPHIVLGVDAAGEGGAIQHWVFESNPPSWYRSVGLARADFAKVVGQTVTIEGVRARDGTLFGYMQKIAMPDGTTLELINSADPK
jgi:hypothetical protein